MSAFAALATSVEPWQGVTAIVTLAGVVGFLFKWAEGKERILRETQVLHAAELGRRDEREKEIRLQCEARVAVLLKEHAEALRRECADNRTHEDGVRREFTEIVSTINDQTTKSASALTEVLGKLHDRFVGSTNRH